VNPIFPFEKKYLFAVLGLVAVLTLCFGTAVLSGAARISYPEVRELKESGITSFVEMSGYFRELAQKKGAEYAFDVLLRADLPPDIDVHLLGHVIGNVLYQQQGIAGINTCTQDFRNACSHSIVIGILTEHGEGALQEIADTCKRAPGGKGAYTMCFHGLGHGVLAYTDYNLEKAVAMCKRTGTAEYKNREFVECVGGTIMEMIEGVHDVATWERESKKYFKESDPLYPCDADFMPDEAKSMCLVYLTPHLFTSAGLDLGRMDPALYPKAMSFCDALPEDAAELRDACYGGFGKEYIGLAQSRDIRNVGSMKEPALRKIREWCGTAGNPAGVTSCNASALASIFWGGENKPDASLLFCDIAPDELQKGMCYAQLSDTVAYYLSGDPRGRALCARMPDVLRQSCLMKVH
jgi:hypothetical protein